MQRRHDIDYLRLRVPPVDPLPLGHGLRERMGLPHQRHLSGRMAAAVYPWYILHQTLIVLIAYWLILLKLGAGIEATLVIVGAIVGCHLLHECVIRRFGILRPLFGLKRKRNNNLMRTNLPPAAISAG